MTHNIAKALNMNPIQTIDVTPREVDTHTNDQLNMDLENARRDIKEIAEIGMQAVAEAASLASQSQHDKLYMALSSVMKSTLEANRELLDVHRSRQELTRDTGNDSGVTNNLFIGSTADLLALLEKK